MSNSPSESGPAEARGTCIHNGSGPDCENTDCPVRGYKAWACPVKVTPQCEAHEVSVKITDSAQNPEVDRAFRSALVLVDHAIGREQAALAHVRLLEKDRHPDGPTQESVELEAERGRLSVENEFLQKMLKACRASHIKLRKQIIGAPSKGEKVEVRAACRRRMPLDGADAQALEHALTITEGERDAAVSAGAELSRQLGRWIDKESAAIQRADKAEAKLIGHRDGKCNCDECRILAISAERDELDTECEALRTQRDDAQGRYERALETADKSAYERWRLPAGELLRLCKEAEAYTSASDPEGGMGRYAAVPSIGTDKIREVLSARGTSTTPATAERENERTEKDVFLEARPWLNHEGRKVPCRKCGSEFMEPKVNGMEHARLVQKDPVYWERVPCVIQCDDCGNETVLWAAGAASAWEQWIVENSPATPKAGG